MSKEPVYCNGCEHLGTRTLLPYCNYWERWINPDEKRVCTARKAKKAKCSICKNEFELYELFCLTSCRGANSHCEDCILACELCLNRLKRCLDRILS